MQASDSQTGERITKR